MANVNTGTAAVDLSTVAQASLWTAARAGYVDRLLALQAGGAGELTLARMALLSNLDEAVSLAEPRKLIAGGPGYVTDPPLAAATPVSGAADVYGAWVTVDAATASALLIDGIEAGGQAASSPGYRQLQIGVGVGGAEVVQLTIPLHGRNALSTAVEQWDLDLPRPLPVAAGVRISMRCVDSIGGLALGVQLRTVNPANLQKMSA